MIAIERTVSKLNDIAEMAISGDKSLKKWGSMFNTAINSAKIAQNEEGTPLHDELTARIRRERVQPT